jgi:dipeptidyl aminopeptidase/acylaminoacyl peptidase
MCHGGPTGATTSALNYKVQFWSSRGFAVVDVNYRGSTGYGRAYREKLKSQWGISDVIDVVAAARHLINQGKADPMRTLIRGSSAGGYTVLAALTFSRQFRAGASLYGIGNLETLATDTHKFESRYLDGLVGPYPEARDRYIERSPIHHTDQLNCPIIFFQGLEDKVVPPSQAEEMVSALKNKGLPVSHVTFQNEGHGFRKAANIQKAIEAELYFYRKILGISSAEKTPAIAIANYR